MDTQEASNQQVAHLPCILHPAGGALLEHLYQQDGAAVEPALDSEVSGKHLQRLSKMRSFFRKLLV
jgi:hypothetical protein